MRIPPFNLSNSIKHRQYQDIHTRIIDETRVELIQSLSTTKPVRPDMIVEPGGKVRADGETARKDCNSQSSLREYNFV